MTARDLYNYWEDWGAAGASRDAPGSLLLLLAASGCHHEGASTLDLTRALLLVARQSGSADDLGKSSAEVARLVALAQRELSASPARSPAALVSSPRCWSNGVLQSRSRGPEPFATCSLPSGSRA